MNGEPCCEVKTVLMLSLSFDGTNFWLGAGAGPGHPPIVAMVAPDRVPALIGDWQAAIHRTGAIVIGDGQ